MKFIVFSNICISYVFSVKSYQFRIIVHFRTKITMFFVELKEAEVEDEED